MSNQHPESLDELLRRATSDDSSESESSTSTSGAEEEYVLPENPYERQMLDASPPPQGETTTKQKKTGGKKKKKKNISPQDIPYSDEEDESLEWRSTLREIMEGTFLGGQWLRHNVWFIIFITVLTIIYVGNGYKVSHERITQQHLRDTLEDRRLRELTLSSELTTRTRISSVEQELADTALTLPKDNVYTLPIKEEEE